MNLRIFSDNCTILTCIKKKTALYVRSFVTSAGFKPTTF